MLTGTLLLFANSLLLTLRLSGGNSFPRPLSAAEERECLERWERGDITARNKLIEHNLRLVAHVVKKYYTQSGDQEDLVSIGTIGLIKAVASFNQAKGARLATYAARCIENEILMYLRKNAQKRNEISIDEPLNVDWDGNELLLSDVLGSDPDVVHRDLEQEAERQQLLRCVARLSSREQQIMRLRFGICGEQEHTQKEVADLMGISQSYISRLEKRIIRRLREEMLRAE